MEKDDQLRDEQEQQVELTQVCGPNTTPYVVRPGDTFFSIARQFGVSLDALIEANPQIPDPSQIRPGQIVCIPRVTCPAGTFATSCGQETPCFPSPASLGYRSKS